MSDKLPWLATESGCTYVTGGSPDPKVNLSNTATTLGGYPTRTFKEAATDSNTDFADTNLCTILIVDEADADTWELYENAVWNDAATDYFDLSSAVQIGEGPNGALSNGDTVTVYSETVRMGTEIFVDDITGSSSDTDITIDPLGTGEVVIEDGHKLLTDQVRAYDGAGLKLYDDGGDGIVVKDGGNVGIGETDPQNKLDVSGSVAIGSSYAGVETAPTDGLLIEGNVSIARVDSPAALAVRRINETSDHAFHVDSVEFVVGGGDLTHIDSDDQGDAAYGVWGDGSFIYLANYGGGLHTYSVDVSGNLTHIDSDTQVGYAQDVWGDGNFIYLANNTGGLHTYSVDISGNLTHIDSDDQGGYAYGVWGDGSFIYLANSTGGLHTYSVDISGNLTHIDSDDQGDYAYCVWGDGNFIYLANHNGGLHTYSIDGSGNLTHIDSDDQGDAAYSVWGDGNFIYLANHNGGLHTYSVDGSGNLTHIDSDDQGDSAYGVWGDGNFIYLANHGGGLHTYSVDISGNLTHIDSDDRGDAAYSVWGDGNFIYLANSGGGLHTYSVQAPGDIAGYTDYFTVASDGNVGIGTADPDYPLDINGTIKGRGGRVRNITTVAAATYDLLATDDIVNVTYTVTGAVTSLTLPTAQVVEGRTIVIKDAGGNAGTNNITIDTEGSETIDGASTATLNTDYASFTLYCDGANWSII